MGVVDLSQPSRKSLVGEKSLNGSGTDLTVLENPPKLTLEETECEGRLISFIVGDDIPKGSLRAACSWYSRHLQMKFKETWHSVVPSLVGLEDESSEPRPGDLVIVYKFVLAVAELLSTRPHIAMVEIVDELDNNDLLKPQLDEERAKPNQIVFAAVGWLSKSQIRILVFLFLSC
jgi:hypothetical protein